MMAEDGETDEEIERRIDEIMLKRATFGSSQRNKEKSKVITLIFE